MGEYWFNTLLGHRARFVYTFFVALLLFFYFFRLRKKSALRATLALLLYFGFGLFVPLFVPAAYSAMVTSFAITVLALFLSWFCFDAPLKTIVFYIISAYALQHLGLKLSKLTFIPLRLSGWAEYVNELLWYAATYTSGWFLFIRRQSCEQSVNINSRTVIFTALGSVILLNFTSMIFGEADLDSNLYVNLICAVGSFLVLALQYNSFKNGKLAYENKAFMQMVQAERNRYAALKENIELVNIKCHDLKHQIAAIRRNNGNVNEQALREAEAAEIFYDNIAKTGCEALDAVLTQKILVCEKYGIKLTYIVDNNSLSMLEDVDIYSLFGNAIDNAIECLKKESDPARRYVSMNAVTRKDFLCIHLENGCSSSPAFKNGLPQTTKKDTAYHGFGTKSIRYVAEKYGGNALFRAQEGTFCLDVMIPRSEGREIYVSGRNVYER